MLHFLYLTTLTSIASAASVSFNVAAFPPQAQTVAVVTGGSTTKLTLGPDGVLWSGSVDVPDGAKYSYVTLDASDQPAEKEAFERTVPAGRTRTFNDFWNRAETVRNHPRLTQVYPAWPLGYSKLYDENYIPTIHLVGDDATILNILQTKAGATPVKFVWVGMDDILSKDNVSMATGGKSSKEYNKQQIALKLAPNDNLLGRTVFKLRAGRTDPSFLRERVYTDIVNAVGIPTAQGCHARLYINKVYRGFYFFEDDIVASFGLATLKKDPAATVSLVQVGSGGGGNFGYVSEDAAAYGSYKFLLSATQPPIADMLPALKAMADFQPQTATAEQIAALEQLIDLDMVQRHAVLEYLNSHWDGAWISASNHFLASINKKWFIVPTDFDNTFGQLLGEVPGGINSTMDGWDKTVGRIGDRPLFEKPIANAELRGRFMAIMTKMIQGVWHEAALRPRLESLHRFLRQDFEDDTNRTLNPITSVGLDYQWTVQHFDAGWDQGPEAAKLPCTGWDCSYGILGYMTDKTAAVSKLYSITFENTYVPPKEGEWFGAQQQKIEAEKPPADGPSPVSPTTDSSASSSLERSLFAYTLVIVFAWGIRA